MSRLIIALAIMMSTSAQGAERVNDVSTAQRIHLSTDEMGVSAPHMCVRFITGGCLGASNLRHRVAALVWDGPAGNGSDPYHSAKCRPPLTEISITTGSANWT